MRVIPKVIVYFLFVFLAVFLSAQDIQTEVYASNVNELLEQIGPDKKIVLTGDDFFLTGIPETNSTYYRWAPQQEWKVESSLIIKDVSNLSIVHVGDSRALLHIPTPYAIVLVFENCSKILLENLNIGHDYDGGGCTSPVTSFYNCNNVNLENVCLYGCGAFGIILDNVTSFTASNSIVTECSSGLVSSNSSSDVCFKTCMFYNNDIISWENSGGGVCSEDTQNIVFSECEFRDNKLTGYHPKLFRLDIASSGALINTMIDGVITNSPLVSYKESLHQDALEYIKKVNYTDYDYELGKNIVLGETEIVRILLDRDADPNNTYFDSGCSAIQAAVYYNHKEIAMMLLEKGANCLIKDRMGRVAMFYTAHCQDRELISMIHRKTDLVYSDEAWRTWEIYAAIYQNWTLFNYLAETYYSIDGLDHDGRGPCIYAAANKNYSFFKGRTDYWMEHADKDGRNVLMYAVAAADTAGLTYYLVNKYSTLIHKINRGKHH